MGHAGDALRTGVALRCAPFHRVSCDPVTSSPLRLRARLSGCLGQLTQPH